jgi:fluoride exporter
MLNFLAVAIGGALGAVLRYAFSLWAGTMLAQGQLPWGTLLANLLGAFLLGFLTVLLESRAWPVPARLLFTTGFVGALTTFSTLMLEVVSLYRYGYSGMMLFYFGISLSAGLLLVTLGFAAGAWLVN